MACFGDECEETIGVGFGFGLEHDVRKEKSVPSDWSDAIRILIPKKGDLSHCINWRGISLLDVIGKVVAIILQERL